MNGSDGSNKNNTSSSSTSSTSSSSIEKKSSLSESHFNNAKVNEKTVNVNTNLNQNMSKRIANNTMANNYNESIKTRRKDLTNGHHNHNGHSNNNTNNFSNNNNNNHRNRRHNSNEAFFGSDSNDNDEFDFEQNLALFDKNAFYEEVEGHSRPSDDNEESSNAFDSVLKHISLSQTSSNHQLNEFNGRKHDTADTHQTTPAVIYHPISVANLFSSSNNLTLKSNDTKSGITTSSNSTTSIPLSSILPSLNGGVQQQQQGKNGNYRFDEMILDTGEPINMQQIKVPLMSLKKNYVTDDGFIVPCIDYSLREMIFEQAYKQGEFV